MLSELLESSSKVYVLSGRPILESQILLSISFRTRTHRQSGVQILATGLFGLILG